MEEKATIFSIKLSLVWDYAIETMMVYNNTHYVSCYAVM